MSVIHILFGEMGSGKNYWGTKISEYLDITFFDGDTAVTPEMAARVSKFKPLSLEILNDYIENHLSKSILAKAKDGDLIVAQALYREEHRLRLMKLLEESGHTVQFWYIKIPFVQNMNQLLSRANGLKWVLYWLLNKPFFQKPKHKHKIIGGQYEL